MKQSGGAVHEEGIGKHKRAHGFHYGDCPDGNAGIVSRTVWQLKCGRLASRIKGRLGFCNARRWFERDPSCQWHASGDTA